MPPRCTSRTWPRISRQDFVDTNITGTLNLLEAAVANRVRSFVFTSTTSTFGDALTPPRGAPAVWITEDVVPIPKNIYGITKVAAEDLCQLFHRNQKLPCLVLRTSRFFPEEDDVAERRSAFEEANLKTNEFLYRRVDVEDVVSAHLLAMEKAPALGFGKFIITATTPFARDDARELGVDAAAVLRRRVPGFEAIYATQGWKMLPTLDRVYDNERARTLLGWTPQYDFARLAARVSSGMDPRSELARRSVRRVIEGLPCGMRQLLDNIMWNCLSGPHAKFATGAGDRAAIRARLFAHRRLRESRAT